MHDADGVPSRRCVKNSTLLRSRVEFPRKTILFFHCLLDRGRFMCVQSAVFFYPQNQERSDHP